MEILTAGLLLALLCLVAFVSYEIGRAKGAYDCLPNLDRADRYRAAVDDLDKWCGEFRHVRLIAAHLQAIGEGKGLNAGTPCGDEPCTIRGLREQLRRGVKNA